MDGHLFLQMDEQIKRQMNGPINRQINRQMNEQPDDILIYRFAFTDG